VYGGRGGGHGSKCVLALNLNARVVNAGFSDAGFMNAVFLNAVVSHQLIALDIGLVVCRRYARDARCIYERSIFECGCLEPVERTGDWTSCMQEVCTRCTLYF
jgi:hypothetical protein